MGPGRAFSFGENESRRCVPWHPVALGRDSAAYNLRQQQADDGDSKREPGGHRGQAAVTVRNPGAAVLESNAVAFVVYHPVPAIAALSPGWATAGGEGLTLEVDGTGFVDGAEVLWNGEALVTTYVSDTPLQAQIQASRIAEEGTAAVVVRNPDPSTRVSRAAAFAIRPVGWLWRLYLPLVRRNSAGE